MEDRLEQEFATYEQALALKELGFDKWCFLYWYKSEPENLLLRRHDHIVNNTKCIPAPLKQQVLRWFREKYDLSPYIFFWLRHVGWGYDIPNHLDTASVVKQTNDNTFTTYEEAENACIDKLIELAKQQDNGIQKI